MTNAACLGALGTALGGLGHFFFLASLLSPNREEPPVNSLRGVVPVFLCRSSPRPCRKKEVLVYFKIEGDFCLVRCPYSWVSLLMALALPLPLRTWLTHAPPCLCSSSPPRVLP